MDSAEIRSRFLKFFADRGHVVIPSASLILDDPTLLFVNAGMVPFKPYFLGEAPPPNKTATSVQKCVRTLDIDEVGKTTRHASFFQMAGNFSFGDYFKEQAIPFAWELLTNSIDDGGYGFDPERLWATVYLDDDEAARIWEDVVGLPPERIQRRGQADNYWSMGVPGPCGPCSEIYYDRGPEYGQDGGPIADEDRFLEVWNLVFMQNERGPGPAKEDYPILSELPAKNIDTGMGLERMASILQGVDNIYEIDTSRTVLDRASEISGQSYGEDDQADIRLRVVTDHARTCTFLINDGVIPGNEGRGYVLRRILRRVVRDMRLLGSTEPSMGRLIEATVTAMAPQYPELLREQKRLVSVAANEEAAFLQTLKTGTQIFDVAVSSAKKSQASAISGDKAFLLHDTHGFPIELTLEMAAEQGLDVDEAGFRRLMKDQRERAKADSRSRKAGLTATTAYREMLDRAGITEFTGYDEVVTDGRIVGLVSGSDEVAAARPGDEIQVVLDRTPFYAEAGGQLGDHGQIATDTGAVFEVDDVQSPVPGLYVHSGRVLDGEIVAGAPAQGLVDIQRRKAISRAHTATHMIHRAFRELLGETATQMGSENAPGRLRFDFPSPTPVPKSVLNDAEALVNEVLQEDLTVSADLMTQDDAIAIGAMALFGEKYGDVVRVVSVGDWAKELCGGTHAARSGQLGVVSFLSEASVGAGVRRVEALVGTDAYQFLAREHHLVNQLSQMVKVRPEELPDRIEVMLGRLKDAEKELERVRSAQMLSRVDDIMGAGEDIGGARLWTFRAPKGVAGGDLRQLAQKAKGLARQDIPVAIAGVAVNDGKVAIVTTVNTKAIEAGLKSGDLLRAMAPAIGGRGGGKDEMAQGGGSDPSGISESFEAAKAYIGSLNIQ
ncbi:alanine--tRNA ligase [Candidatus Nanopelagicales bacterium]|nr:alanine--tRNA ligase [Candidatus Nanopelagicales bacterium]